MTDDKLPDIPSFEDLGISEEELAELERELDDPPAEGDAPPPGPPPASSGGGGGDGGDGEGERPQKKEKAGKPASEPAPWKGYRGPLSVVLMVLMAWIAGPNRAIPSPVPATAADTEFSSARAMAHLVQIARRAHPPGSPEHSRVREYLIEQLRGLGFEPEVQTTTTVQGFGATAHAATVRNIVARMPGTASQGSLLITAHYDGREVSRAAGDDGSGVVAILEALRALQGELPLRNDLIVLITDAEELGLMGARAFADEHRWMDEVSLVLSIEMRGGGGPSIMFETGAASGWVVDQYKQADPHPVANSLSMEIYKRLPNDTDFTPFKEAGKQGLNFAGIGNAHVYHQAYDSPDNLSEATLQHHGSHAVAMLRQLGNAELSTLEGPDPVYFDLPFLGLVVYPAWWSWVLGGLGVLLWGGALVLARRGGARWSGTITGFIAALIAAAGSWGLGLLLFSWRVEAHPEAGALHGSTFHSEGWYVLALAAASFLVVSLVFGILRRWFSVAELAVGALILPLLLTGAATVMAPLGAMNVQWPMLGGALAAAAMAGVARQPRPGVIRWLVLVLAAVPVIVLLRPLVELIWLAMNISLAPVLGALMAVTWILVLPLVDVASSEPNRWWSLVGGALVGGALLGGGMMTATPSAERPAPSTLVYLVDWGENAAYWGSDGARVSDAQDPGMAWAVNQAGEFQGDVSWEMGSFSRSYATTEAPLEVIPMPTVSVVGDSVPSDRVRLSVSSRVGAEMMEFAFDEDGPELLSINGKRVPNEVKPLTGRHWGTPVESVVLEFDRGSVGTELSFAIVEHHFRPGELVGSDAFERPPELAPNIRRGSDRAMLRTPVVVDLGSGAVTLGGRVVEEAEGEGDEAIEGAVLEGDSAIAGAVAADSAVAADTTGVDSAGVGAGAPDTVPAATAPTDTIPGVNERR